MAIEAVFLDVGGVVVVPDGGRIRAAGVPCDPSLADLAHHTATRALDVVGGGGPGWPGPGWATYAATWCATAGVPPQRLGASIPVLLGLIAGRSDELWVEVRPGAHEGLAAIAALGLPVVIVSNADGRVADILTARELCQAGAGAGTEVVGVLDSHLVGSTKPDAGIFLQACELAGVEPASAVHVGDTVTADVVGALGAGVHALHLDPHGLCDEAHEHVATLLEVAAWVEARRA